MYEMKKKYPEHFCLPCSLTVSLFLAFKVTKGNTEKEDKHCTREGIVVCFSFELKNKLEK